MEHDNVRVIFVPVYFMFSREYIKRFIKKFAIHIYEESQTRLPTDTHH